MYVLFEYVRPQSIYAFLDGPPWSLISLLAAVAAFLSEGRRPNIPSVVAIPLIAFAGIMIASSIVGYRPAASVEDLKLLANWILLIVLVSGTAGTEKRWFLFLVLYLIFCFKMSQHGFLSWAGRGFTFTSWGVTGGPNWFQNSGEFALQMSMFAPLSIYFIAASRRSVSRPVFLLLLLLPTTAIGSVVASSSRGGLLALVVVGLVAALRSKYKLRALFAFSVGLSIIWAIVPAESKNRFDSAGSDATSVIRLRYWKHGMEMANSHPFLGVGQGSWTSYYRDHYVIPGDSLNRFDADGLLMVQPAHNSFVEVASQLGYLGLAAFLVVIASTLVLNFRTRKIASQCGQNGRFFVLFARGLDDGVIAFCVAGFFMSVAYYPFIWMQLAMSAGLHCAVRHSKREIDSLRFGRAGQGSVGSLPQSFGQKIIRVASTAPRAEP